MKSISTLFILFSFFLSSAQLRPPEAYVEIGGHFEEQFEPLWSYYHVSVGAEPLSYKFIALDVNYSYYFGGDEDEDIDDFDRDGEIDFRSRLYRDFSAWVGGIGPKFIFDDDTSQFVIIPKYHFGNVKAKGDYSDSDGLEIDQETKENINYWSLSIGYEFLSEESVGRFGIYLSYTRFNAGKALNKLDFEQAGYSPGRYNTPAIGVTLRFSSGFKKQKT
ncbi:MULTISPECIES: hypothetical protein [Flavobacteriaceae]|uniref:hypothetical protein n=1 Tax=Flavobacteriaceae TaxID=49546 RepID=UPI001491A2E8|nr:MULTISPECIES: hypothetical protein [Allomuricauda]MDC6366335.1 hypothetical protein [Muricauda sp. AC10]